MGVIMLKSTGIVRKIDQLGRLVIPKELRRNLGINEYDGVEIYMDGDLIVLKKVDVKNSYVDQLENIEKMMRGSGSFLPDELQTAVDLIGKAKDSIMLIGIQED